MHSTLRTKINIGLAIGWGCVAGALLIVAQGTPSFAVVCGGVGGIVSGLLQGRAMTAAREAFLTSESALDVRRALTSTSFGKASLAIQWVACIVLIVMIVTRTGNLPGILGSLALFFCVRETSTLPAVVSLNQHERRLNA